MMDHCARRSAKFLGGAGRGSVDRERERRAGRPRADRRRRDIHAQEALGQPAGRSWREHLGAQAIRTALAYVWVYRFPMYQWDADRAAGGTPRTTRSAARAGRRAATRDRVGRPGRAEPGGSGRPGTGMQYDLALNGWELGGGSIRIQQRDLLERARCPMGTPSRACGSSSGRCWMPSSTVPRRTAASRSAWTAGRRCWRNQENIREVTAFPKTQSGSDLMLGAPRRSSRSSSRTCTSASTSADFAARASQCPSPERNAKPPA